MHQYLIRSHQRKLPQLYNACCKCGYVIPIGVQHLTLSMQREVNDIELTNVSNSVRVLSICMKCAKGSTFGQMSIDQAVTALKACELPPIYLMTVRPREFETVIDEHTDC
jgi:hypothetical protein